MPPPVLVVDDDSLLARTTALNLEDVGFSSAVFGNGRAAVDYVVRGGAAVAILLDWQMPELDGAGVLAALHRLSCPAPVIVISGDARVREAAIAAGAVAFIEKSRGFDALRSALRRAAPEAQSSNTARDDLAAVPESAGYRQEASRLVGLVASSPFTDTKDALLRLAQHFERWRRMPREPAASASAERLTRVAREWLADP